MQRSYLMFDQITLNKIKFVRIQDTEITYPFSSTIPTKWNEKTIELRIGIPIVYIFPCTKKKKKKKDHKTQLGIFSSTQRSINRKRPKKIKLMSGVPTVFPDMNQDDEWIVDHKMIDGPTNSIRAVLVFVDGDGGGVRGWIAGVGKELTSHNDRKLMGTNDNLAEHYNKINNPP